ncbi:hypothetical protein J2Y54_000542 [Sphingomonas sp. BE123]|uniref:hypothetical protein n=1 Tax=Sphingomonas sp. BE123 TaxID=2817842 RepID=UPI0028615BF5|nr:hypothetical protein [Sphingomonas sp. BE123]MDR6851049.1 hypothetical protein [Sphingomonas sp. BE123]
MADPTTPNRTYDADGFRRIRPSERSRGFTELRLPNGRCFAAAAFGPDVDQLLNAEACRRG